MSLQIRQKEICFSDTWPLSQYPHNRIWPSSLSSRCSALLRKLQGFTHTFVNFSDIIHSYGNISPGDEKFWVSPTEPGWGGQWGAGERGGEAAVCLLHIVILKWRHLFSLGLVSRVSESLILQEKQNYLLAKLDPESGHLMSSVLGYPVACGCSHLCLTWLSCLWGLSAHQAATVSEWTALESTGWHHSLFRRQNCRYKAFDFLKTKQNKKKQSCYKKNM